MVRASTKIGQPAAKKAIKKQTKQVKAAVQSQAAAEEAKAVAAARKFKGRDSPAAARRVIIAKFPKISPAELMTVRNQKGESMNDVVIAEIRIHLLNNRVLFEQL